MAEVTFNKGMKVADLAAQVGADNASTIAALKEINPSLVGETKTGTAYLVEGAKIDLGKLGEKIGMAKFFVELASDAAKEAAAHPNQKSEVFTYRGQEYRAWKRVAEEGCEFRKSKFEVVTLERRLSLSDQACAGTEWVKVGIHDSAWQNVP